jgi:hypothetical protein
MSLLKELLGFVVLTGPLFLLLIWLPIAIWLANKFAGRFKHSAAKITTGIIIFSLLFLLPFVDEIIGKIYLKHLCTTERSAEVFQTVGLPVEYWDEAGIATFINARGVLDAHIFGNRFHWNRVREPYIEGFIKIEKWHWQLEDKKTQKILGGNISFSRQYGWLSQFYPGPVGSEGCPNMTVEDKINFLLKIFKQTAPIR